MKDMIGIEAVVLLDGGMTLNCTIVADAGNGLLRVAENGVESFLSKSKVVKMTPKAKKGVLTAYMCQNGTSGCKGRRAVSAREDETILLMECPLAGEHQCDFGPVAALENMPYPARVLFLNGMKTAIPPVVSKKSEPKPPASVV